MRLLGRRTRRLRLAAPRNDMLLIRSCEIHFTFGRLAADDAGTFLFGLVERDVARGGLGILLDLCFTFHRFTPIRIRPTVRDDLLKFVIIFVIVDVRIAVLGGALEERTLYFLE